jgi:hypothetical protein
VKVALVQAAVVVGVGAGVTVTVHEHVFAAEMRVCMVVGMAEVAGGLEAERGTVRVSLPEMASTTEDEAVLAEMVGSVTPAGVEVRVAATAVEDDGADTPAAAEDDVAPAATDVEDGGDDTTAAGEDADVATAAADVEVDGVDTTATTVEADEGLVDAVAETPLAVRLADDAMARRGAVLILAAVTTPSPFMVRVTGFAMFSIARQSRLPGSNDAEKRFAKNVNRSTATSAPGLVFPAKVS